MSRVTVTLATVLATSAGCFTQITRHCHKPDNCDGMEVLFEKYPCFSSMKAEMNNKVLVSVYECVPCPQLDTIPGQSHPASQSCQTHRQLSNTEDGL